MTNDTDQDQRDSEPRRPEKSHLARAEQVVSPSSSSRLPADRVASEDTELETLRRNYSRASAAHVRTNSISSKARPSSVVGRAKQRVWRFWSNQVSVTVPHEKCRDHLGETVSIYTLKSTTLRFHSMYHLHLQSHSGYCVQVNALRFT